MRWSTGLVFSFLDPGIWPSLLPYKHETATLDLARSFSTAQLGYLRSEGLGHRPALQQIVTGTEIEGLLSKVGIVVIREYHHGRLGGAALSNRCPQHLEAVHMRHSDVQKNDVEVARTEGVETGKTIGCNGHDMAVQPQDRGIEFGDRRVILDQKDLAALRGRRRSSRLSQPRGPTDLEVYVLPRKCVRSWLVLGAARYRQ